VLGVLRDDDGWPYCAQLGVRTRAGDGWIRLGQPFFVLGCPRKYVLDWRCVRMCDNGELSLHVDGVSKCVAFTALPRGEPLFPAVEAGTLKSRRIRADFDASLPATQ